MLLSFFSLTEKNIPTSTLIIGFVYYNLRKTLFFISNPVLDKLGYFIAFHKEK